MSHKTSSDIHTSRSSYTLLCFLTLLNVMNFVDRQMLASFANFIVPDLGLTNVQFGYLTGLVFIFFYAIMGVFMGVLADLFHRPRLIAGGVFLWSLLTAASGFAKGFISLAIPRMFIGVGESVLTPTSMSLLADRFPKERLGFAAGFYYMGVPVGVAVSLLVAGYLGPSLGWRNCFYILGGIGMVLALFMLFVPESKRVHLTEDTDPSAPDPGRPSLLKIAGLAMRVLAFSPALLLVIAGGVTAHFILGAAQFDQLWYVQERGFERSHIAQVTGWIGAAGGILGTLFGGIGCDWWQRRFNSSRPMFLAVVLLVLVPIGFIYRVVDPNSWVFWAAIFFGYFQLGCFYGPTFATVQELVPPQIRSTIVAFYILTLNLIGLTLGVTLSGYLIDGMIAMQISEPFTKTLLILSAMSATSIPLFYLAAKRVHRDKARLFAAVEAGAFK